MGKLIRFLKLYMQYTSTKKLLHLVVRLIFQLLIKIPKKEAPCGMGYVFPSLLLKINLMSVFSFSCVFSVYHVLLMRSCRSIKLGLLVHLHGS